MGEKIVLTGIARSKGKAAGEAAVNRQRMGWAFNHVGNEDGIVLVPGADLQGQSIIGKVVVYPTVMGSTTGAISLYYKCTQSHHGPAAIICQKVHEPLRVESRPSMPWIRTRSRPSRPAIG
jgi:predicted aconitase with swiveling domain